MQKLNLPAFKYHIQCAGSRYYILDVVRKKHVHLTAEEWIRQHFLHYLIHHLSYPKALIKLERSLARLSQHRPDILVYNRSGHPLMLVECKAPTIQIAAKALGQIARYNIHLKAKLLVITNGLQHFCWKMDDTSCSYTRLQRIPCFNAINAPS